LAVKNDIDAAIAATRFGLGARPGEIATATGDPRGFLKGQITSRGADQPPGDFPSIGESLAGYAEFQADKKAQRVAMAAAPADAAAAAAAKPQRVSRNRYVDPREEFMARAQLGATTDAAFRERWALFWSNHFAVAANKSTMAALVGHFEREAIRPHVFGRFEDLLVASTRHPGMLFYLDQSKSVGPNSRGGARRKSGLNENLAREVLELHTLGVGAGYSQQDVTEFARALTGWSFYGANEQAPSDTDLFVFHERQHEPGARTVFHRRYAAGGEGQARAVLRDLATDPNTAKHLATKIARHFVADDPPPALVSRLETTWNKTGGELDKVAETLVDAPEAWDPTARKFKTPYEFMVSGYRAIGGAPRRAGELQVLTTLGQKPFTPPSPKGWDEEAGAWSAPDAIIKRMAWSQAFAQQSAPRLQPVQVAQEALGARLTPACATIIARAESRPEALAVLLMSPEFQRR
jgi:uncharacterized protein (DUF1800 family)